MWSSTMKMIIKDTWFSNILETKLFTIDPLKFSDYVDVSFLREAEIKHGRICMLAILGFMVAEIYTFPFYVEAPHVVAMRHDWAVKQGSLQQILLWCSFFEIMTFPAFYAMWTGASDRQPGDFSFDPLGLGKDPAKKFRFQVNEIKNGRLAMVAVGGAVHHALLTNQNMFEQISNKAFFLN